MSTIVVSPLTEVYRTNLIYNPRFIGNDTLTGGWGGTPTQTDISTGGPDGGGYTEITLPGNQTGSAYVNGTLSNSTAATEGDTLTLSMYFLRPRAGHVDVRLQWFNAEFSMISQEIANVEVTTADVGAWVRCSVTATAPAGTAFATPIGTFSNATLLSGDAVGIAMRLMESGSELLPYFDGNSAPVGDHTFAWTGAENVSTSVELQPIKGTPDLVLDYAYNRQARTIVHDVLNRSDADVTMRPVGLRTGTLNLFCAERETASQLESMHMTMLPLTLDASEDEPTATMTYVATGNMGVSWDSTYNKWTLTVQYQEVTP